ncbi:hypothetical protein HAX54_021308 [Datura stramonium]|uniref:Uncharacterized protein n=1 Tax=Datura stramonium TaxID=4076 RepID=A0ABS8UTM7_DATST|nr:hypothetical protein [Datura stramonium]
MPPTPKKLLIGTVELSLEKSEVDPCLIRILLRSGVAELGVTGIGFDYLVGGAIAYQDDDQSLIREDDKNDYS